MSHLICKICDEGYSLEEEKLPRALPCGHSFCHKCLQDWANRSQSIISEVEQIECPTCRACCPVPAAGFPRNFALLESLESKLSSSSSSSSSSSASSSSSSSSSVPGACAECEKPATVFCRSGCGELCASCSKSIHSRRFALSHALCDINEKPKPPRMCDEHKNEVVKLYCSGCQSLICPLCAVGKHRGHELEEIAKAAQQKATVFQKKMNNTKNNATKLQLWLREVKKEMSRVDAEEIQVSKSIGSLADKAIAAIRSREQELRKKLTELSAQKRAKLTSLHSTASNTLTKLNDKIEAGRDIEEEDPLILLDLYDNWLRSADVKVCLPSFQTRPIVSKLSQRDLRFSISAWGSVEEAQAPSIQPADIEVGCRLDAHQSHGKWYGASVLEVDKDRVLIHFDNFDSKYDEWIPKNSDRLANIIGNPNPPQGGRLGLRKRKQPAG